MKFARLTVAVAIMAFSALTNYASADQISEYYYSAKRTISPDLFHRDEITADDFGKPYLFVEKFPNGRGLLGVSTGSYDFDEKTYYAYDDPYADTDVNEWVFSATDLALQIEHIKEMKARLGIPPEVARESLIAYEEHQLERIRTGGGLDVLPHINWSGSGGGYSGYSYTSEEGRQQLAKLQRARLEEIQQRSDLSRAEVLFVRVYDELYYYACSIGNCGLFLIWEQSCECGNGQFSIAIDVDPGTGLINIASEFAYRVCNRRFGGKVRDLRVCEGTHQLGGGQRIYLAGDYRYQLILGSEVGALRTIRFRDQDMQKRLLRFSLEGHEIEE